MSLVLISYVDLGFFDFLCSRKQLYIPVYVVLSPIVAFLPNMYCHSFRIIFVLNSSQFPPVPEVRENWPNWPAEPAIFASNICFIKIRSRLSSVLLLCLQTLHEIWKVRAKIRLDLDLCHRTVLWSFMLLYMTAKPGRLSQCNCTILVLSSF